jgi:4-amino-4-deoxy-L-arabinose transferase-like glycosyltransferase
VFNKKLLLLILCSSLLVLIAGLTSTLCLGDEVMHFRFAKAIYNTGERVVFDPLYGAENPLGYFYRSDPLWHTLLAFIWRLSGKVSFPVAQFYHTVYYALLILFTYLLGKELYGRKEGLYSALIVATVPAIAVFSVLFYLDIPATCLSILCLLLIIKKRFLWSGVILGLMYLTKRNACFFAPAFFFLVFYQTKAGVKEKLKNLIYFSVPAFLIILPDFLWRESNIKSFTAVKGRVALEDGGALLSIKRRIMLFDWDLRISEYLNSSFVNPVDIVKYFGIVLLIALVIYILLKIYEKRDLMIWLPVVCYFFFFCYIFHPGSDIRYLLPMMPLLAILSSKVMVKYLNKRWLIMLFVLLCFLQFSGAVLYVRAERQVPKGIDEGFTYLRENTAKDALVIYPEYVILERANRRFAWAGNLQQVLRPVFWSKDDDTARNLLKLNEINYIAIKKARIYDDSEVRHFGGYPKSFVERLPELSFVKLVFDNSDISIWQIE